jgi:non-canonical (house-cleaning) NTP pyrophosphatase
MAALYGQARAELDYSTYFLSSITIKEKTTMLIALGSQSEIKRVAITTALRQFGIHAQLVAVKASSDVSEQPFDDETITGAKNRALHTAALVPGADLAMAIESGIFARNGQYLDIAVVLVQLPDGEMLVQESEGVVFPSDAVEEAKRRGTAAWTVGKILQESGRITLHNDPHLSLVGRSRAEYINDAVLHLFQILRDRGTL